MEQKIKRSQSDKISVRYVVDFSKVHITDISRLFWKHMIMLIWKSG